MIIVSIINEHPVGSHPFSISLTSNDVNTDSGIAHRELIENGNNDILLEYMLPILENHHISSDALKRHKELVDSLRIINAPKIHSPYPRNLSTQKGNFAEIFLAEYIEQTTDSELPVYRLRYNPNPDQSMKGDDVLCFDLDSDPVRIIVGESKFRGTPDKQAVTDIVDGLLRSNKEGLPISLIFVAERLFQEGKVEIGKKIQNCAVLYATNKLNIDYVGLLMSNINAKNVVKKHTSNDPRNLLMISLGIQEPEKIVQQAFKRLEDTI